MGKIIDHGYAGPDHPIYRERLRSFNPYAGRALLRSKKISPERSDGSPTEQPASETAQPSKKAERPSR